MLNNFYLHDAVRGHYYLWPSVCLFVSATSWFSIKTAGRIGQIFGTEASFDLSYSVLWRNSDIYTNKGASLWNSVLNSEL